MGASSFSPSPMTTTPFMLTVPMSARIASTAAPSPPFLSPRPAAMAAASVTRTNSRARLRSGAGRSVLKPRLAGTGPSGTGSDTGTSRSKDPVLPTLRKLRAGPGTGPWAEGGGAGELPCDPRGMTEVGPTSEHAPSPGEGTPPPVSPAIERANRLNAANMLRSLLPLVVICLLIVGWQAFRSSGDVGVRTVDPSSTVQLAAARAGYVLQVPA